MIFNTIAEAKEFAKQKLQDTDYAVLPDVSIANKKEFEEYRKYIRQFYLNPMLSLATMEEPKPEWIIQGSGNIPVTKAE